MANKIYDAELQYLTVAFAKRIGLTAKGAVGSFDDLSMSQAYAGLAPLLVYSIVAPAYRCYERLLVDPQHPVPLSEFLSRVWARDRAGLGMPLKLEIKASLMAADRGFASWVRSNGIELAIASPTKSIDAFERVSRDVLFGTEWAMEHDESNVEEPRALAECNQRLMQCDRFKTDVMHISDYSMDQLTFDAWRKREKRFCESGATPNDWNASAIKFKEAKRPRPGFALARPGRDASWSVAGIKELVAMWPGGPKEFFKGLSVARRDFDFWASGRACLSTREQAELMERAVLHYIEEHDEWELGSGYLLEATTTKQVVAVYDELSHGGDIERGFELLGPNGEHAQLRVAVFMRWAGLPNILLFARDGGAEQVLDKGALLNFGEPLHASPAVWSTALHIIANKDRFEAPATVGKAFYSQHAAWLDQQVASNW